MSAESDFTGRKVGRYQVVSLLGRGGMGAVYRAYDAALERHVAIKILPPEVVTDADRVNRFVQEAKAASGLNHPHVIAIHDIGVDDSTHYIAMELIEGETLREKLRHGRLDLRKAVTIVSQIADALAAAHAVGIVHRDLKPENVMIASSGYVKILDFGLAKLRGATSAPSGGETATAIKGTEPGKVMGTVGYMSPEQAQGKEVDHRADIFALGCILFELSTGISPFRGNSSIDTMHKIIYSDPEPLRTHLPNAPMELQWILRKALAKDPEDRYQSAKDLAIDLRDLVRELESNPSVSAVAGAPKQKRALWIGLAATLVIGVVVAALLLTKRNERSAPDTPQQQLNISRVTSMGKVISATISPDGKLVSYVLSDQGQQSLWIRQLSNAQSLELVPPARVGYWGNVFTPDGSSIIYAIKSDSEVKGAYFQISVLGGTPRKLLSDIDTPPTFSPDGTRIAWCRADFPEKGKGESALVTANLDGSDLRVIAKRQRPEFLAGIFYGAPSWSSDGKRIATPTFTAAGKRGGGLIEVDVETGKERALIKGEWKSVGQAGWLPDGSGLLMIATSDKQSANQVWFVPYPEGEPRPVTNDLFDYRIISLTKDGSSLVTVASDVESQIWRSDFRNETRPQKLTVGKREGLHGVSISREEKIAYVSWEGGSREIWLMNADGSDRRQLTFDGVDNRFPTFTPDGKTVVYLSVTGSGPVIYGINIDATGRREIAKPTLIYPPSLTPDGKWIVYSSPNGLAKAPIDGGASVPITDFVAFRPAVSADGKWIAYESSEDYRLWVIPFEGGTPVNKFTSLLGASHSSTMYQWSADGRSMYTNTMPDDRANLWRIPLDGSPPQRLTDFDERILFRFVVTPENKLVYARGDLSRDAVLITGFR